MEIKRKEKKKAFLDRKFFCIEIVTEYILSEKEIIL